MRFHIASEEISYEHHDDDDSHDLIKVEASNRLNDIDEYLKDQ